MKVKWFLIFFSFLAMANDEVLNSFEFQAKRIDSAFGGFSIKEGEKIFRTERVNSKGLKISCMSCHTENPKKEGLTRNNKVIDPLAPVVNKDRFTDMAKVEKWFKRNCKDVYDRECSVVEKGHFTKFMMSIK